MARDIQAIAQPKFDWDMGLRQADQMAKLIQKNKVGITEFFGQWRKMGDMAVQQARLQNSLSKNLGNGAMQITVPTASSVREFTSSMELANREMSLHGELLKSTGTQIQNWGKNTQWAGRQLMVGFTIPFAAAAAAAGVYAYTIDKELTRIEKVYDGSTEGLRKMSMETAKMVTQTMGQPVKETLDVMGQLAAVGKQGVDLQRSTAEVQRLTTLGEMDRMDSLKAVISLQSTFKMSTQETTEAINYMNAVENATSLSMQDFAEAIPRAAAPVAELGGSIKELGTILVAMKERGVDAAEGSNAIKTVMNRLLNPAKETEQLFQQLTGKSLKDFITTTKGQLMPTMMGLSKIIQESNLSVAEQQQLIGQLAGSYQMTRMTSILQGLADTGGQVGRAMEVAKQGAGDLANVAGNELQKQVGSLSGQFNVALEGFKSEFQQFGEIALRVATLILKSGEAVLSFVNNMPDWVKGGLVILGAFTAIAGPLVMIAGLIGNLIGTGAKLVGSFMRLAGGYKSMTIEQKAAQMASGTYNKMLLTEADSVQILIFQLEKLQAAYKATNMAATAPGNSLNAINGMALGRTKDGSMYINDPRIGPRALTESEKSAYNEQVAIAATAKEQAKVTDETKKSAVAQRAFTGESLLAVSAVSGIASMAMGANSSFAEWLNYISLASVALYALMPILGKIGTAIKANAAAQSLMGIGGGGLAAKAGGMLSGIGSFLMNPATLLVGAGVATAYGIYSLVTAESREQLANMEAVKNSTDLWSKSLGFVKQEMGQIKTASGEVKDTVDSIAQKMREENSPLVQEVRKLSDGKLYDRIRTELYKLQGQGLPQEQITQGLDALLRAAGKKKEEIDRIMSQIKFDFDFTGSKKDLDKFLADVRKRTYDSTIAGGEFQGSPGFFGKLSQVTDQGAAGIKETAKTLWDRMVNLDPSQRAYLLNNITTQLSEIQKQTADRINQKFKGTVGFNSGPAYDFETLVKKYTTFSAKYGVFSAKTDDEFSKEIALAANSMRSFTTEVANLAGVAPDVSKKFKTFSDLLPHLNQGTMSGEQAIKQYGDALNVAERDGRKLTDEQKLQLATIYALAGGLDAAKLAAGEYTRKQEDMGAAAEANATKLQSFLTALKNINSEQGKFFDSKTSGNQGFVNLGEDVQKQAQTLTNTTKQIYSGTSNTIMDALGSQAERQFQARLDSIAASYERKKNSLDRQSKALDKSWDARMKDSKKGFDQAKKQIEKNAEAEIKSIDNQIKALQEKKEKEQEIEEQRQAQFEAEQRRIERLNEIANRNIDFNRAMAEGNLDEAARIQNNLAGVQAGWGAEDDARKSQLAANKRSKELDLQITELNERKQIINEAKAAKLEALAAEEEAVTESLQRQREMEKEALQERMDNLQKEQRAKEDTERRKQEIQKKSLEIELATLREFVPQNEAELWSHIGRVQDAYGRHGIQLTIKGGEWGQIIGNALQSNVDRARINMSNDAAWASFGAAVAGAISNGAFGLSLGDFFNMLVTGNPPAGWKPPGASKPYQGQRGDMQYAFHTGGYVGRDSGGRLGRSGGLYNDEVPAILQKGEYVLNKSAVDKYGTDWVEQINSGKVGIGGGDPGVAMAGMFGGIIGTMMRGLIGATFLGAQEQSATTNGGLSVLNMAQKAGVYGGVKLSDEQLRNANIIANVGKNMGASTRDIIISLMTAMQESTLRNLNYGDRDSVGLFQQRTSQGWGSIAQIMNPEYAAMKFFQGLLRIKNRDSMSPTLAAQAVQRSAFPYAYAKWQSMAEALVGAGIGSANFSRASSGLPGFGLFARILSGSGANTMVGAGTGRYVKPTSGRVTSEYGNRRNPISGRNELHDGIDIGAPSGTPIYATDSGTVISAGMNSGGFGNWTILDHGGIKSGYAHQSRIVVSPGQRVSKGQLIGYVGSTGYSTGPHLHFQMGGGPRNWQNPRTFIPGLEIGGMIKYDNTLANLHKDETVLTAPLSAKLERGIDNLDKGMPNQYYIDINIEGTSVSKEEITESVISAIEQANRNKDKRLGKIR